MSINKINEIGQYVSDRLEGKDFSLLSTHEELVDIAVNALKEIDVSAELLFDDIVNGKNTSEQFAPKHIFGDGRITLYKHPFFVIEINLWGNSYTCVHEHCFTGAFKIIRGNAFNAKFSFEEDEKQDFAPDIALGKRTLESVKFMQTGMIQAIDMKDEFIHKIVHTETPTATLIVRGCQRLSDDTIQRQFARNFGYNPRFYNTKLHQAIQMASISFQGERAEYFDHCRKIANSLNKKEAFYFFESHMPIWGFPEVSEDLIDIFKEVHGDWFVKHVIQDRLVEFDMDDSIGFMRTNSTDSLNKVLLSAYIATGSLSQAKHSIPEHIRQQIPDNDIESELWAIKRIHDEQPMFDDVSFDVLRLYLEKHGCQDALYKFIQINLGKIDA